MKEQQEAEKETTVDNTPEECSNMIFELSGIRFEPSISVSLWEQIMKHKWYLSEKLHRDVGARMACIDFLDNQEQALHEYATYQTSNLLREMGAMAIGKEIWDTISDSQPPKQLVQKRIILPLQEKELCQKHGVNPPKTLIFFGPPGTGKTHFVKAIAGALSWWYVELLPSMLMADGVERIGINLQNALEKAGSLENAVVFIDEFEELGINRDNAERMDKSITNTLLKQIPLFKKRSKNVLLICATNYIRQLDKALLRPGRFDCIIPVGTLDNESRKTVLLNSINKLNAENIDIKKIVAKTENFTPADIELAFNQVAQFAFEKEYEIKKDFKISTETILEIIGKIKPSLNETTLNEFHKDSEKFSRV